MVAVRPSEPGAGPARPHLRTMPGLDGLRGLAVAAVVAFHLRPEGLPGGFLGVDLFFVLSGFLITSLLLIELDTRRDRRNRGQVDLGRFWARRARRLLPALFITLVAVTLASRRWLPGWQLGRIRGDGLAALAYISNWHDALRNVAYFDSASSPSPFAHLWSLAIEEQIYLLWPLTLLLLYRMLRGRRAPLAIAVGALVAASAAAMAVTSDHAFAYLATHTRAQALLLGALLAVLTTHITRSDAPPSSQRAGQVWAAAGTIGLVGLAVMVVRVHGEDAWMYHGGFTLAAGLGVLAVAGATRGVGPLGAVTTFAPLRVLGRTSYGIYLYHWPVIVFLNEGRTGLHGWTLDLVRLAVVAVITTGSYLLIEHPIRSGRWRGWPERVTAPVAVSGIASLLVVTGLAATAVPTYLAGPGKAPAFPVSVKAPTAHFPSLPSTSAPVTTTTQPSDAESSVPRPPPRRIVLIGDSVANSLAPGIVSAAQADGISVLDQTVSGCGIVTNSEPALPDGSKISFTSACRNGINGVQNQVASEDPDLVLVLSTWEAGDRTVDGTHLRPGSVGWKASLTAGLQEMLERVRARGAEVMFMLEAPRVPGEIRDAIEHGTLATAWPALIRKVAAQS
ncbi:MAG: acyltransferase, partial [Pseudonocardia sp.]|nr:acyltransferase [Pseudonocardia sp.]